MINLPNLPFRVTEIDENDPFVKNALKDRKHFEPCWCGSGKKYKKCHRLREQKEPYSIGYLRNHQQKIFWRKRGCMHPLASPYTCSGTVIDSHTIQRKGPLEQIVDETGHVMHFNSKSNDCKLRASKIGWRKASIFPGYCSDHDSSLFEPIERGHFSGEHSQCVLQAFRNVCNELYRKQALIEVFESQRGFIDRGRNTDAQINIQKSYSNAIDGQNKSMEELVNIRTKFELAIVQNQLDLFESRCYFFQGSIDVVSSSIFQCEFDFQGEKLIDIWDLSLDAEMLSHSVMTTDEGGAIVFVWLKSENDPGKVVDSFDAIPKVDKGDIFIQYCFVNCENTFFAEYWWESLSEKEQMIIQRYAKTLYYEGGKFQANENKLVEWNFAN